MAWKQGVGQAEDFAKLNSMVAEPAFLSPISAQLHSCRFLVEQRVVMVAADTSAVVAGMAEAKRSGQQLIAFEVAEIVGAIVAMIVAVFELAHISAKPGLEWLLAALSVVAGPAL